MQPWELSPVLTLYRILPQLPGHQIGGGHPASLPTVSSPPASAGLQSHVGPKAKAPRPGEPSCPR